MTMVRRLILSATLVGLFACTAACGRLEVGNLYAVHLREPPETRHWSVAVPLLVKAGGGSVHGRPPVPAGLEIDTDAVHGASASCHHGPPVTHPTPVEMRAYYTEHEVSIDVRWDDPTEDRTPRSWRRAGEGWEVTPDDEDGIAILWSAGAGRFGCQEACHQSDFAVRSGSLVDVRSMFLATEGGREEAWIWKPSLGGRVLLIDRTGFITPSGAPYRTLNSRVAHEQTLGPEARRAGMFGKEDAPLTDGLGRPVTASTRAAPAGLWAPAGEGSRISARAERRRRGWRVVFTRPLEAGAGRQTFRPGERHPFGIAVFDGTSVNHHVVRDTQVFELVAPPTVSGPDKEGV